MKRTFTLTRLYHQCLKPLGIPLSELDLVTKKLSEAGFIELQKPDRYSENEKFTNFEHRKEFFKILQKVKNELPNID